MGVPKHEVWSREQFSNSNSKACRKTRTVLPEWYRKALIRVPENEWCRKTRLGVLEGYRKATFWCKGWLPGSPDWNAGISAEEYRWNISISI